MLLHYSYTVICKAKTHQLSVLNAIIALIVFGMVGESSFVKLTGLAGTLPSVNLTIINVMAVAFFLVFWTHGDYSAKRVVPGIIVSFLYVLGADGSFGLKNMPP